MNPNRNKPAFPAPEAASCDFGPEHRNAYPGLSVRDYMAIHSTQPGCSETVAVAGLKWSANRVWSPDGTELGSFENWWEAKPLAERLLLVARVRYMEADAMLQAAQE